MRSRAVMLPFPGDPFLLFYWLDNFAKWAHAVDALYIYHNSTLEIPMRYHVREFISTCESKLGKKVVLLDNFGQIEHGEAINKMLDSVSEMYIMLAEDDCFVVRPEAIDEAFSALEGGQFDIVGSKRGSCSKELLVAAERLWGLSYEGYGDQGPNFWPAFFFCEADTLRNTSRQFGARAWKRGETIAWLNGHIAEDEVIASDTFVEASLELRSKIPQERIKIVNQYHAHPSDLEHFDRHEGIFDGGATWVHIGSLSSGIGGVLRDKFNRPLVRRSVDSPQESTKLNPEWCTTDMERQEWERRAQWWLTFFEFFGDKRSIRSMEPYLRDFHFVYGQAVWQLISQYGLNLKRIRRRQEAYKTIGL